MRHPKHILSAMFVGALLLGAAAHADITEWQAMWLDNSPLNMGATGWYLDSTVPTDPAWEIWESYVAPVIDDSASRCIGAANADPTLHIVKTITNNSTFVWTDYHVVITGSPGVAYVPNSATSDVFGTIVESGGYILDFYAPNTVPIGSSVTISFAINLPAGGFQFDIAQTPTPEPASAALLALVGLFLRRR